MARISNIFYLVEENINELEDTAIETTQNQMHRTKHTKLEQYQ